MRTRVRMHVHYTHTVYTNGQACACSVECRCIVWRRTGDVSVQQRADQLREGPEEDHGSSDDFIW